MINAEEAKKLTRQSKLDFFTRTDVRNLLEYISDLINVSARQSESKIEIDKSRLAKYSNTEVGLIAEHLQVSGFKCRYHFRSSTNYKSRIMNNHQEISEYELEGWTLDILHEGVKVGVIFAKDQLWHWKTLLEEHQSWVGSGSYDALEYLMADILIAGFVVMQEPLTRQ